MIIMVYVVKGHQRSAHIRCPNHGDESLLTPKVIDLDASITEMNFTAQYSFQSSDRSGCGWLAIYSAG